MRLKNVIYTNRSSLVILMTDTVLYCSRVYLCIYLSEGIVQDVSHSMVRSYVGASLVVHPALHSRPHGYSASGHLMTSRFLR